MDRERARDVITHLLDARSVAVIGASSNGLKAAGRTLRYLQMYGYDGEIFPVNPNRDEVQGLRCYRRIHDLPSAPELAVIVLPAPYVIGAVEECGERGIPAAIVFASGFAETGPEGTRLQAELADASARADVRVLGPNCNGAIGVDRGLTATFMSGIDDDLTLRDDGVAFVTQSGAMGAFILHQAQTSGLGLGRFLSTGNEMDVSLPEAVVGVVSDPATRVVLGYVEGVRAPQDLRDALGEARDRGVPVCLMKVGRSVAGASAAVSHTGALAGQDDVFDGLLAQYGAIRATDVDQLLDLGRVFALCSPPKGRRLSIVTLSGGAGVLMADAAEDHDIAMAPWDESWSDRLRAVLPPFASVANPIDVTGALITEPELLRSALEVAGEHPDTDIIAVMLGNMQKQEEQVCGIIADAAERTDKPIVTVWVGGTGNAVSRLAASGLAAFTEPVRAIRAIAALTDHHVAPDALPPPKPVARPTVGGSVVDEVAAKSLLAAAGVPTVDEREVTDAEEAGVAADAIGYPVAVKLLSTEVSHKSDLGFVRTRLPEASEVGAAAADMLTRAAEMGIADRRLVVQRMVKSETELILGMRRDPVFGPAVVLGVGGVLTEVLSDFQVRLPPLTRADAYSMMDRLRSAAILTGVRGRPTADREALADAITAFADFVLAHSDDLETCEINPMLIDDSGKPVAVDALLVKR